MTTEKIRYAQGTVRLPLGDGQFVELPPQECWELAEKARLFLVDNLAEFDQPLIKVIEKNGRSFKVVVTKDADWWSRVENSDWEPETFKIFDDFITPDVVFLDVGAWIGPTTLYAAQLAKRTHAFEPDPIAYRELESNVRINEDAVWAPGVTVYNRAIAPVTGAVRLGNRGSVGDSMSSSLFSDAAKNWEAEATTLEEFIEAENLQDEKLFIKMDIEGGEYELAPKLKTAFLKYEIVLLLSIHPYFLTVHQAGGKGGGLSAKILRTLLFVWRHMKLVRALPFRYFYSCRGRQTNLYAEIIRAGLRGRPTIEIVATNNRWNRA